MEDDPSPEKRRLGDSERERALGLIRSLRDPTAPDEVAGSLIDELTRLLAYPRVTDLLFRRTPELTDEEVVETALRHHPFVG